MAKRKVGVFGGNFDPFHYGHLNSMLSVAERFELNEVRVVPAYLSPLRVQTQGSSPEHRLEMLKLGIRGHEQLIHIDTCEIDRGGTSYTIDTVEGYVQAPDQPEIFLIVGMDQFAQFDQWRDFERILQQVDLIVTSRPGRELPYTLEDFPIGVRALVADFDSRQAMLKSGHSIHFMQLEDVDISGTEARKRARGGQSIQALVPLGVESYVHEQKLYEPVQDRIGDFAKFSETCRQWLNDKGCIRTEVYDLRAQQGLTEFTLIGSGTSTRHTSALAEHLIREVKKEFGVWPENMEGQSEGRWVVVDYGALIVHLFYDYVRQEYRLEELWAQRLKK